MSCHVLPIKAFNDNYIWLLTNPENQMAVCVDPGDAKPVLETLNKLNLQLSAILITHHHMDHVGGVNKLLQQHQIPVYGPANDGITQLTHPLKEGNVVQIPELDLRFDILDLPGHTKGHIAYYGHDMLFCGDTLFTGGCGRLFEGTPSQMYDSLQKLAKLPPSTWIYAAHEYTEINLQFASLVEPDNKDIQRRLLKTQQLREQKKPTLPAQLAIELRTNPFLRCSEPTVKQHAGQDAEDPIKVFAAIRRWKDTF